MPPTLKKSPCLLFLAVVALAACKSKPSASREEQVRIDSIQAPAADTNLINAVRGGLAMSQLATTPSFILLTGLPEHRLVTIYKEVPPKSARKYNEYGSYYYEDEGTDRYTHYMPGLDLLYGYNLLNLAHYDLKQEKMNYMFDRPVLIKSVYYPSFVQDSLHEKPINRSYYFISVYDADTNKDTLLTKRDLRSLYYFNASTSERVRLIPEDHSVERSQYDSMNDVMYVYARHDENHDGTTDRDEKRKSREPLHVFWIDLKVGNVAKRLY
ncbi:MAG: hypothetical protein QM762_09090 [Chryseolinea sp.]